jgi:NodT family efflux transporter outer membrane factor (OMF) lipoprotein
MEKYLRTLVFFIVMVFLTSSCNLFKPEIRKSPEGELPRTFSLYTPGPERPEKWWEELKDQELNVLVEEALSENFTLKEAWARLNQAQALAVQVGSRLYPELTGISGASYTRQRVDDDDRLDGTSTRTIEDYSLGLISSYELDLWGRIRSEREAARLEAKATREDLNAAAITLAAEVTERWANIISQRMQKRLLERQLRTNLIFLELVELRFRKAMVSVLDVYQQKQVVERVKAEIPLVEEEEQLLLHELALLLGKPPRTPLEISRDTLPLPAEIPATGLPADLLAARPDVRATGLRLQAADYQVAAARADRLPAINLTAAASYGADKLDLIFENWLLRLAGNLAAPIFDGKRRIAEVDRTRAIVDENLSRYRETVLTAIKEVEDALVSEMKQREHIEGLKLQMSASRKALEQAGERYRRGLSDYLPVLTQLLAVQELERDLIQQETILLIDRIRLYRALGGTWVNNLQRNAGLLNMSTTEGDPGNEG